MLQLDRTFGSSSFGEELTVLHARKVQGYILCADETFLAKMIMLAQYFLSFPRPIAVGQGHMTCSAHMRNVFISLQG